MGLLRLPNIQLVLEDAGTLGSQPCSTLTLNVRQRNQDLHDTMDRILQLGAALRPGAKFGRHASALVIRTNQARPLLPLAYLIATGQIGRRLIETAQKHNPENDPVTVWVADRGGATTTARRINDYLTPPEEKRDELSYIPPKRAD